MYPLSIVVGILVARSLGPHDRGLYAFLGLMGSLVLPLLSFGFGGGVIYLVSSGKWKCEQIASTVLAVGIAQGLFDAAVVGGLRMLGWLGKTGAELPPGLLAIVLAILPAQGASLMLTRLLLGAGCYATLNVLSLAMAAGLPLLLAALVLVAGFGLPGAVAAYAATNVLSTVALVVLVWRRFHPSTKLEPVFFREASAYGAKVWLGDVAARANLRFDQFVLGAFATASSLGRYSIAVGLTELLWLGPDSLGPVLFNRLAGSKGTEERAALTEQIHRALIFLVIVLAAGLGLVAPWLVPLVYGSPFAEAVGPLLWLLPGSVLMVTTKVLTKFFGAAGRPGQSSLLQGVGAVASLVAYLTLIPPFGIVGAAVASSIGYAAAAVWAIFAYRNAVVPHRTGLFAFGSADWVWSRQQLAGALSVWREKLAAWKAR
jgi:O-antigen/teichoic acid export membrane protein